MIKAVVFDLDNTLYSYDKAHSFAYRVIREYAERTFGWTEKEFDRRHHEAMQEIFNRLGDVAATHNRVLRYQRMIELAGLPLHPYVLDMNDLYWGAFFAVSRPYPGALEALDFIRSKGMKVGIATNMTAQHQFVKLSRMNFLPLIDFMVSSEETITEKPNSQVFLRCAEKAGAKPDECLMIGDSVQHDIHGAICAGLKAIWVRAEVESDEKTYSDDVVDGVPILYRFRDIESVMMENGFLRDS
ncbi:MAG: HAD-IA family hydrolase [Lachnospiraceae bacterium]|nr:HAD-IA family hydrolase [Lachnospiraceae bacterium]